MRGIFGSQVSALRSQVRVIRYRYGLSGTGAGTGKNQVLNLYPNLSTRTRLPTAETRDLKFGMFSCPDPYPYP